MTFTLKEKELLKSALHLYIQETAGQYDFVEKNMSFSHIVVCGDTNYHLEGSR